MEAGINNWVDISVIVLYFIFVIFVGIWSIWHKERSTTDGYFLAGRAMLWFPMGASLFSSNIGSEHFIGLAGSGAASGIAVVAFEWGSVLCLLLLGWVFLPVYLTSGIFTIPEYLNRRFGGRRLRTYLSLLLQFLNIITKISVDVYAGSVFVQQALGWNTYISIAALLTVTAIYTVIGGLAAVIFTDTLQTIIMLVGSIALSVLAFMKVGGIQGLMMKYSEAIPLSLTSETILTNFTNGSLPYYVNLSASTQSNLTESTCGMPRSDAFHILRDPIKSDLPWPGILIRSTFVSVWYWCASQVIVQRTLAAKSIAHARAATILASYLKFLPLFLIIMPGMISRVLYPETVACADPETCLKVCDNAAGCSNIAYPQLILGLAPTGMRGLMVAVMMAAVMSSLTSIFNSASTLFTMDIWKRIRNQSTERELLIVGKIFVVLLVGVSILWIPLIKAAQQGQLFLYIQALTGYVAPPICSLFLLAIFVPRVNEQGAFWGLVIGHIAGLTRMVLDFVYPSPGCGKVDDRPGVVKNLHFTYFSAILLVLAAVVIILVSLVTERPSMEKLKGLTFWTSEPIRPKSKEDEDKPAMENETLELHAKTELESSVTVSEKFESNPRADRSDNPSTETTRKNKLYMDRKTNLFLNINACILLIVFVFLYCLFG